MSYIKSSHLENKTFFSKLTDSNPRRIELTNDTWIDLAIVGTCFATLVWKQHNKREREREKERETDRQTDTGRQTERNRKRKKLDF